ncbi:hypothetical protein Tco_1153605 [Tanacetum coccineum]
MDNPNITMEEYIRLEEEKARRRVIVFNDTLTSEATLSSEPAVSSLHDNKIDFRISFDESNDEDYTVILNSFSYKIISANDLKTDSENDNEKVNMPSFPLPEPTVSCFDDLDFFNDLENEFPAIVYNDAQTSKLDDLDYFKDFKKEFPAIVYNDAQTSKLDFSTEPVLNPQHIDEYKDNDDDKVDIEHSSRDLSIKPLPAVINTDVGAYAHRMNGSDRYGNANLVGDALSRKERVKSRRVRGMILAAQSEAFKQENVLAERLHGLDQQMERKGDESLYFMDRIWVLLVGSVMDEAHASSLRYLSENEIESPWILSLNFQGQSNNSKEWNSGDDQLRLRWMIYLVVLADAAESVRDAIGFEYCLASSSGWTNIRCAPFEALYGRKCRSPVLWAEIRESSLTGLELVQEMTNKVVLVKEKPKAVRDRQKSYVDYRCKPLEFELGNRVLLKVMPWKGVVHFGEKGKLAPRYVGPIEILERIGLVAYRLRLHEELNSVHDTFHVSNLKKYLADASMHVPLDEIKVDKTFRFVEEPVKIMNREIRKFKHRKIALVKVKWNSKRGPEFSWEHKDQIRIKYPQLFVD